MMKVFLMHVMKVYGEWRDTATHSWPLVIKHTEKLLLIFKEINTITCNSNVCNKVLPYHPLLDTHTTITQF